MNRSHFVAKSICNRYLKNQTIVLVDIGALDGLKSPWDSISKFISYVGFEPQEGLERSDSKDGQKIYPYALGKENKKETIYITKRQDNSSFLKPNFDFIKNFKLEPNFEITREISVEVRTLDDLIQEECDFLKIDTQGTEHDILSSGGKVLEDSLAIDVEVNLVERYVGQKYFEDVHQLLKENNFIIFDFQRRYWKRKLGFNLGGPQGQLTHGTALYLKDPKYIKISDKGKLREKLIKLIVLSLLYNYNDYSLQLTVLYKDVLGDDTYTYISNLISKNTKSFVYRIPYFKGRYQLYKIFKYFADILKSRSQNGVSGDQNIGNTEF